MSNESIIVIGAGPAGLAAAHELIGQGFTPLVLEKAVQEISRLGLVQSHKVEGGVVFFQRKAYPVYHLGYRQALETIQKFLSTLANLQTIGRNGM
jgi:protoporphyrinogen oxidase